MTRPHRGAVAGPAGAFGEWNSVVRRFSRWSANGVWWPIFEALSDDPDFEYLIVASTILRAHSTRGLNIKPLAVPAVA